MSRKNSDTRSRILEATWALMEHHHGRGVRMSDIAARAGVSRQALYLHFDTRADLLIATTRHMDEVLGVQDSLQASRNAATGIERIRAFVDAWGHHLPKIHGVAGALLSMREDDAAAGAAWDERMAALREGCEAAIRALDRDGKLAPDWTVETATDLFWAMLSVRTWELLSVDCGWSTQDYVRRMQNQALGAFASP